MRLKKITLLSGDGIGPEVSHEGEKLLKVIEELFDYKFEIIKKDFGGIAIDKYGIPLPEDTLDSCKKSDAVLLAAIGGPKYDNLPREKRPETGLLGLRAGLNAFSNLRPVIAFDSLLDSSTIKKEILSGTDLIVVRELTGGLYFGKPKGIEIRNGERVGFNTMLYAESEIRRIAKVAFDIARKRKKKVTSTDKANILDVSQLWRDIVTEVSKDYKDVTLEHLYIDNASMQLIKNPRQFDVILAENLFGDILSDEGAMLTGSIGMLPSASMGDGSFPSIYEPVHGSAPDIAGKNLANPIAMILSIAMMFKYSFNDERIYDTILKSVKNILNEGYRTKDIQQDKCKLTGTVEMGDLICKQVKSFNCKV
ncbi:MAG: 3-isopropylmalate dehydrogenase [Candidatus Melainabacteria bacterium RIFCSPLOWO2_02_FULL_35_15]|nr:MAG: 3-isopropylmalate dehydrogenase [Candidatus Melainabacteria bacterium RIFCSPLOWO2_12_FULL_35_11]OGI14227.1 MAG: 3-isopropylmalate dehydrogenase [Candidatus Melainabacteria bacterium RIFCSPLOWO2_02_FULL_35_15]